MRMVISIISKWGIFKGEAKVGMGVQRRKDKGECKWEDTTEGGCHKGEYQRRVISKVMIPKP